MKLIKKHKEAAATSTTNNKFNIINRKKQR